MPLLVLEQGSEAWHQARIGKITASIASSCLGLGQKSRAAAYRSIIGHDMSNTWRDQQWGKDWEPRAREEYEEHDGCIVAQTGFWVHPDIEWLGASPDGLIGDDGLVEIKCPSTPHLSIPDHYRVQMIVQMAVSDRAWCDLFSWCGTEQSCHRLKRDLALETRIIDALRQFKLDFLDTCIEPPRKKRGEVLFELPPIA